VQKEQRLREEAKLKAMQRILKKKESRDRSQKIAVQQQQIMSRKVKILQERDAQRRALLEEQKEALAREHEEKALKAKLRVKMVLHENEQQRVDQLQRLSERMSLVRIWIL